MGPLWINGRRKRRGRPVRAGARAVLLVLVFPLHSSSNAITWLQVLRRRIQILGTTLRARDSDYKADLVRRFAVAALPGFAKGLLNPVIDSEFDLSEIQAAHTLMESNTTTGKIILRVADSGFAAKI